MKTAASAAAYAGQMILHHPGLMNILGCDIVKAIFDGKAKLEGAIDHLVSTASSSYWLSSTFSQLLR